MVDIKKLEPIGGTVSVVNLPVAMLTASNMPMRDCMAMAAMQAELMGGVLYEHDFGITAKRAYTMADAMLAAREQK